MFVRAKQNWFRRTTFTGAVLAAAMLTLGATPQPAAAQYAYPAAYPGYAYPYNPYYPYYAGYPYYPYYYGPRCRVIWTYYGPRRVCRWHHRWHHRHWRWRHRHWW